RFVPGLLLLEKHFGMGTQIALFFFTQVLAGQNEYGKSGRAKTGAPFAKEFKAAYFWQHHIENHELRQRSGHLRAGLRAIGGSRYNVSLRTEHLRDEFARGRIVFHHENRPRWSDR